MKNVKYKDLSALQKKLLKAAKNVIKNSYSPYSKFKVGAAVLTKKGKIIAGTNYLLFLLNTSQRSQLKH